MESEDYYSVEEAAKVLKLTPGRISQMLRAGSGRRWRKRASRSGPGGVGCSEDRAEVKDSLWQV